MIFRFFDETGLIGSETVRPSTSDTAARILAQCQYCKVIGRVSVLYNDLAQGYQWSIGDGAFQMLDPTHPCQWWRKSDRTSGTTPVPGTDSKIAFNWTAFYPSEVPVGNFWYDAEVIGSVYSMENMLDMVFLPKTLFRLATNNTLLCSTDARTPVLPVSGVLDPVAHEW